MSEERALVPYRELTPDRWKMISDVAPAMHQSRLFGVTSAEQAKAIMLKGYELGLSLTSSFEFIQVIQGRPTLSPRGCLALIQQSPLCTGLAIKDEVDNQGNPIACVVWMKRTNGFEYTARFSTDDARRAGVIKPDSGWETYPSNMLRWRAVGFCADVVFPDVIGGLKRADELGADLTPEGDVIEGRWQEIPPSPTPEPTDGGGNENEPKPAETTELPHWTLDRLVAKYGAADILAANEGRIPGSQAEIDAVAAKLEAKVDG